MTFFLEMALYFGQHNCQATTLVFEYCGMMVFHVLIRKE